MTSRALRVAVTIAALAGVARTTIAQKPDIPVRQLRIIARSDDPLRTFFPSVHELGPGIVLVEDSTARRSVLYDASLRNPRVLSDTSGLAPLTWRRDRIIRFLGDSVLRTDMMSRALLMIDAQGKPGRALAIPSQAVVDPILNSRTIGTDGKGRLIFIGQRPFNSAQPCVPGGTKEIRPPSLPTIDTLPLLRADFDARAVDTVAFVRVANNSFAPLMLKDANCKVVSATVYVDPSMPPVDTWTVTSDGLVAIVRGTDYHVDWIDPANRRRSTPPMPFDWRQVTNREKQAKRDTAKYLIDSVSSGGGYRMQVCPNTYRVFTNGPQAGHSLAGDARSGAARGAAGDTPDLCQIVSLTPQYASLAQMANRIPPVREHSAMANRDGEVWILPTTSSVARGGLVYDVVTPLGELTERVQLPPACVVVGFGPASIVYIAYRSVAGTVIERAVVERR